MAELIGLAPDNVFVRGSRRQNPPIPKQHAWKVECSNPQLTIDEQLEVLVARLRPHQVAIRKLIDDLAASEGAPAGAHLGIYRHLDDPRGEAGQFQHRLLGWVLSEEVMRFALDMNTWIEVDEYGQFRPIDYVSFSTLRWQARRSWQHLGQRVRRATGGVRTQGQR